MISPWRPGASRLKRSTPPPRGFSFASYPPGISPGGPPRHPAATLLWSIAINTTNNILLVTFSLACYAIYIAFLAWVITLFGAVAFPAALGWALGIDVATRVIAWGSHKYFHRDIDPALEAAFQAAMAARQNTVNPRSPNKGSEFAA